MKKSISDILAEIDKLYSKIHAHLSMARSDLDEVWYWIELGGEVEDLLYQKTDLENLEDYNRYEEELKVFEEKYAMYCHFEKIDGREVLVQETCRTSKLISDTKELLQTIDTNRFKNPRNGIIGERSDKSKMIFLRSAKNECKNEVTSLCDDLEKINGLSLELENLRMEVDMLHELDDLRKKRK